MLQRSPEYFLTSFNMSNTKSFQGPNLHLAYSLVHSNTNSTYKNKINVKTKVLTTKLFLPQI